MEISANLPRHVAIIMDGNGRWAEQRGKKRSFGHREGSQNVNKIAEYAFKRGIKVLSLFAFSSENWLRPKEEVDELMRLLKKYFDGFLKKAEKNEVGITVMGDLNRLSPDLRDSIDNAVKKTEIFKDRIINIGINYGGRAEIVNAANKIVKEGLPITEEEIVRHLYTSRFPDPDLIIRTGGELRLSNFMLFQSAYSELYFTDVLWPDFNEEEFEKAILSYSLRKRRFGSV